MGGQVSEIVISCHECGTTERLTVDDLPNNTPINCNSCGKRVGWWGAIKVGAIPVQSLNPTLRVVK